MKVSVFNRVLSLSLYCITTLWEVSVSPMFLFLFHLLECLCWVRKTLEGGYCYAPPFFLISSMITSHVSNALVTYALINQRVVLFIATSTRQPFPSIVSLA